MKPATTEREQAEQRLAELEAEVARVRGEIAEHETTAREAAAATERAADSREDLLARGADASEVEAAGMASCTASGRANEAAARARGLVRLLGELEEQLPDAAVALGETSLVEFEAARDAARARLDQGEASVATVAEFCSAFAEADWCRSELHRCVGGMRFVPGSYDLRFIIEHNHWLEQAHRSHQESPRAEAEAARAMAAGGCRTLREIP